MTCFIFTLFIYFMCFDYNLLKTLFSQTGHISFVDLLKKNNKLKLEGVRVKLLEKLKDSMSERKTQRHKEK